MVNLVPKRDHQYSNLSEVNILWNSEFLPPPHSADTFLLALPAFLQSVKPAGTPVCKAQLCPNQTAHLRTHFKQSNN